MEVSFSRWRLTQRSTTGYCEEKERFQSAQLWMEHPYLTHASTSPAKAQGIIEERRLWEPEVIDDYYNKNFSGHNRRDAYVNSYWLLYHTQNLYKLKSEQMPEWNWEWNPISV